MEGRFKLSKGVKFREEDFGGLVFVPSRTLVLELNQIGYTIIKSIAEGLSLKEILQRHKQLKERQLSKFISNLLVSQVIERRKENENS